MLLAVVGDDDVGLAVAVDVGDGHGVGLRARGEGGLGLEGAVAVAQEHAHGVVAVVGGDDVGLAVAVDVGHGHGVGSLPVAKVAWLWKVPSPLPRSTLTLLPLALATTMSGLPSPLTSATATERGCVPVAIGGLWLEGAVAVAQEHAHAVARLVGDDHVGLAVAVDVGHRHGLGY